MEIMSIDSIYWIILLLVALAVLGVFVAGGNSDAAKEIGKFFGIIEAVKE